MINQKRSHSTKIKRNVSYEKNNNHQLPHTNASNNKAIINQHHITPRPHSQPSKPPSTLQQAKTTRITITNNTSQSTNNLPQPTLLPSKLTTIPTLPTSPTILTLNYSNHKITTIPKNFPTLYSSLTNLNLSNNQLTQFLPICYLQNLQQLNLSQNIITHVPKQIRKLSKLLLLDLSFNKLWYLSQVISLKELVCVRCDEMNSVVEIILEGNSVMKTNLKAVSKILSYTNNHHQESSPPLRTVINQKLLQNKENLNPNILYSQQQQSQNENITKHNHKMSKQNQQIKKKTNKRTKSTKTLSKSFNQSLLDVSAIMGPIPPTLVDHKTSDFQAYSQTIAIKNHSSTNKPQPSQSPQQQTPLLSHQKQLTPANISHSINALFSQSLQTPHSPTRKNPHSFALMFKKINNFDKEFIQPFSSYLSELKQIEKKLKLIQNINQIPECLKVDFVNANLSIVKKISLVRQLIKPFDNFYHENISEMSQNIESFLIQAKGSIDTQLNSFQQKILQTYLNSSEVIELEWYEVWLNQVTKYNKLFTNIQNLLTQFIPLTKKVHKLARLTHSLQQQQYPQKQQAKSDLKKNIISQQLYLSKSKSSRKQLNNLLFSSGNKYQKTSLFSSSKKQSLLLTQKPSLSINNQPSNDHKLHKNSQTCLECPIKNQQIIELNLLFTSEQQNNLSLNNKINQLQQQLENLLKNQHFYHEIQQKQSQVIQQLHQVKPSTYQNVLLTQALSIEHLILGHQQGLGNCRLFDNNQYLQEQYNTKGYNPCQNDLMPERDVRRKTIMTRKDKTQLNQFLLTEQSTNSHKKPHNQPSQRTYFKSNGTLPFSHSQTTKYHATGTQKIQKTNQSIQKHANFYHQTKFKSSVQPQISKTLSRTNQLSRFDQKAQLYQQDYENEKNEVFEKIIVREFDEQKAQGYKKRQNTILSEDILNKNNQKDELKEKNQFKNDKNTNDQTKRLLFNRIDQNQQFFDPISKKLKTNQSQSFLDAKKHSKTHSNLHSLGMKQFHPIGYDYQTIEFKQNIQYQNYLKYHLRNNIKQILTKKQSLDNDQMTVRSKNLISTDLFSKPFSNWNDFPQTKHSQLNNKDLTPQALQNSTEMRKNPSGKYIKQHRYTVEK